MVEGTLDYMGAEALPAIFLLRCLSQIWVKKETKKMRDKHFSKLNGHFCNWLRLSAKSLLYKTEKNSRYLSKLR